MKNQLQTMWMDWTGRMEPVQRKLDWPTLPSELTAKIRAFVQMAVERPSVRLLVTLLLVDGFFVLLHLLTRYSTLLVDPALQLDWEQGYGEIFQYAKFAGIIVMLAALARQRRTAVTYHWIALFTYLLLDDALMIHETVGGMLATSLDLAAPLGVRAQDVGELLVYAGAGLFFLLTLTLTYQRSAQPEREMSQYLVLLMAALLFVGVVLDVIQYAVSNDFLFRLLTILEDGGEHVIVSVTVWFVFIWVRPVLSWQVRAAERVRTLTAGTVVFVLLLAAFSYVQYGAAGLAGNDGYYHAKMGWLVRQQGLAPQPPQLPLTILNEDDFYDHHLLYHAYLGLFAAADPADDGGGSLTQRAKEASVLLAAAALTAVWWLLRRQGVPWAFLWTLGLLAASHAFLYRMSMPRAQSASLLLLALALHLLLHGRYRWLLPLGFAYVWFYNAFPLLLVVAGVYFVALALLERRFAWAALAYPAAGILFGLVINPYFPQNVIFVVQHILPKVSMLETAVGNEWYPYDTWALVQNSGAALAAACLGALAMGWREERVDVRTLTLFVLTAGFGLMLFRSRRFVEYFPAFAVIFLAFSAAPLLAAARQERPLLFQSLPWLRWALPVGIALLLSPLLWHTLHAAHQSIGRSAPPAYYADSMLWLKSVSEPGSVVFQTDWDDFPRLYFYNSDAVYTIGLDPTYMELYDADLFQTWVEITRGQANEPGALIAGVFEADYVFSDLHHEAFLRQAETDPYLSQIYRDGEAVIFRVER